MRLLALVAAAILAGCGTPASGSRDTLWRIVSQCVDALSPGYCTTCAQPMPLKRAGL